MGGRAIESAPTGAFASAVGALREVVRNRAIRRIELAWTIGTAADWAYLVIVLVVAYEAGGALAAGILGAVRVAPAVVAAPFATSLVGRFRGDRALSVVNLVRAAGATATALAVGLELPVGATYLLAAVVAGSGALVRPIQMALLPAFARSPKELVAANVASSTGEGVATFAGPLLASLLLAVAGPVAACLFVAGAFVVAAAAVTAIQFEHAADARAGAAAGRAGRFRIRDSVTLLRRSPTVALLVGDFTAQVFVRGMLITFIVVASIELLGLGEAGVGLLNGALGLGALVGAFGALGLRIGPGLARAYALSLAGWGIPLVVIGGWPGAVVAIAALGVTGVSNATLDVSGFTLLQRGVRNEDRVAVFGLMESLFAVALLLGSLAAPALLALLGTRGAFIAAGALLPLLALLTWRPIAEGTRVSESAEARVAFLRTNPLFAPLPLTVLDRLAEGAREISFARDAILVRKGEGGDRYHVLADGQVEVRDGERKLAVCGPGEGIGEISLLRQVPRTATAVALTPVTAYEIEPSTFLSAVAGPAAAAAAEEVASSRLQRSSEVERAVVD